MSTMMTWYQTVNHSSPQAARRMQPRLAVTGSYCLCYFKYGVKTSSFVVAYINGRGECCPPNGVAQFAVPQVCWHFVHVLGYLDQQYELLTSLMHFLLSTCSLLSLGLGNRTTQCHEWQGQKAAGGRMVLLLWDSDGGFCHGIQMGCNRHHLVTTTTMHMFRQPVRATT